jgi:hypothetical protein|uniref:Uncharacterized protein n=1 Tax=Zea mays TaxID=4577 RepID=A0A804PB46_MAIZE
MYTNKIRMEHEHPSGAQFLNMVKARKAPHVLAKNTDNREAELESMSPSKLNLCFRIIVILLPFYVYLMDCNQCRTQMSLFTMSTRCMYTINKKNFTSRGKTAPRYCIKNTF